jgi:methyl-accepting chemotaxis protein
MGRLSSPKGDAFMNFDDAIKAHVEWKMKLKTYIAKPDRSLDAAKVGLDNQCVLGKWLHGEGAKFASNPKFSQLVAEHAKFHKAAAQIITKAESGASVIQDVALGAKSEFADVSQKVVSLLMECKKVFS